MLRNIYAKVKCIVTNLVPIISSVSTQHNRWRYKLCFFKVLGKLSYCLREKFSAIGTALSCTDYSFNSILVDTLI
jgi:hypothetical protein